MSSEQRKWAFRIRHMLEAIEECQRFVEGMSYEQFYIDAKSMKAVVWNISTIGEAAAGSGPPGLPIDSLGGPTRHAQSHRPRL